MSSSPLKIAFCVFLAADSMMSSISLGSFALLDFVGSAETGCAGVWAGCSA